MLYHSTRDIRLTAPSTRAVLEGIAPDGGLFLPQRYPRVDAATLASWRETLVADGYAALAARVLALYVDDMERARRAGAACRRLLAEAERAERVSPRTGSPRS